MVGQQEVDYAFYLDTDSSTVSSVSDRNRLNPQNRSNWPHKPCSVPLWFDRVSKKLSVKADLTIYSHVFGVSR